MSPPVFIVDTNVVVAGMLTDSRQSPVAQALDAMLAGTLIFLMSPALLDEYRAALLRPKLAKLHGLTEAKIDTSSRPKLEALAHRRDRAQ